MHHVARRPGWTRIELLVVAVVLVTAVGLLATVLQYSREPAQRAECAIHLQRMGKAIHAFHDKHQTLPASCIAPGYATWAVQIAPFFGKEDGKALSAWNTALSYYDQSAEVRAGQVRDYYCPARRPPGQLSVSGDVPAGQTANYPGALGDYACSPTSNDADKPWNSPEADGAFIVGDVLEKTGEEILRWKARTTLAALKRGQAYTILVGERNVPMSAFGHRLSGDGSLYNGDYPASFARLIDATHGLSQGPNDVFNLNFGSWHPGICQFLMADGSLRVSSNNVNPEVLQNLIPRGLPE